MSELSSDLKQPVDVTLGVPSEFTLEWVKYRHGSLIAQVLEEVLSREVRLMFAIAPRQAATPMAPAPVTPEAERKMAANAAGLPSLFEPSAAGSALMGESAQPEAAIPATYAPSNNASNPRAITKSTGGSGAVAMPQLNPRYTFDTFVVGPSNRLAQAGAQAIAQQPGTVYNPLFLYGPPGLGKTHLMHAIGHEIAQQRGTEGLRVAYISGEEFTTGFITSLREQKAAEFRKRSCSVDVWLVDDIQFIAGKESTKEEFFHTFNALYQNGKQIVISSDRSPRDLRTMDERLRSRFESGLVADIAPPDLETRLAILHRKAEFERMRIPDEVLLYMARLVRSNIRTLEGALVKLIAYSSLVNMPITTELAASVLERYYSAASIEADGEAASVEDRKLSMGPGNPESGFGRSAAQTFAAVASMGPNGAITPELVQRIVAKQFGMNADVLSGKKRDREIVQARQIAMHLTRELTELSMPTIGERFGGRDHSTVAYSCDKVRNQLPIDDDFRKIVEDLTLQVRAQAPS